MWCRVGGALGGTESVPTQLQKRLVAMGTLKLSDARKSFSKGAENQIFM